MTSRGCRQQARNLSQGNATDWPQYLQTGPAQFKPCSSRKQKLRPVGSQKGALQALFESRQTCTEERLGGRASCLESPQRAQVAEIHSRRHDMK